MCRIVYSIGNRYMHCSEVPIIGSVAKFATKYDLMFIFELFIALIGIRSPHVLERTCNSWSYGHTKSQKQLLNSFCEFLYILPFAPSLTLISEYVVTYNCSYHYYYNLLLFHFMVSPT